jgi:hypothetical protein
MWYCHLLLLSAVRLEFLPAAGRPPHPTNLIPYLIKMFIVLLINQKDYGPACRANQSRAILRLMCVARD